jgi:pimeloyl-ACP methyl ester carboxylesterase
MPYATNTVDGVRTWFEDDGGEGPDVIFYPGFTEPLAVARANPLVSALEGRCRRIFADHRGHGRSERPHEPDAYALPTRAADVVGVLDALRVGRAHFVGFSWGARLGFAFGEHAPERAASLVLCGNQPYAWRTDLPLVASFSAALADARAGDMARFIARFEELLDFRFPDDVRASLLENDALALDAAWQSAMREGPVSPDLARWRIPCLIYAGALDDMHDDARRGAAEIPTATFISLEGHTHVSAESEVAAVLPHVVRQLGLA